MKSAFVVLSFVYKIVEKSICSDVGLVTVLLPQRDK